MMEKCRDCGIMEESGDNLYHCYYYQKELEREEVDRQHHCMMFINKVYEDNNYLLPPQEHVLLKKGEIEAKK